MTFEFISILEQGLLEYFLDLTNIFDYPQFSAYVTYYHYKRKHVNNIIGMEPFDYVKQQYYEVVL